MFFVFFFGGGVLGFRFFEFLKFLKKIFFFFLNALGEGPSLPQELEFGPDSEQRTANSGQLVI